MKWMKIISREYGVQYTELSLRCLSDECAQYLPVTMYEQVYVPDNKNEVCFFEEGKWNALVSGLEREYASSLPKLREFEELFVRLGSEYRDVILKEAISDFSLLENSRLKELYEKYYTSQLPYGTLIWTSFIINNLVSKKASDVLRKYMEGMANEIELYKIALSPVGKAAVLQMQEEAAHGQNQDELYEKYKWMSCLDLHNEPWTREQFAEHLANLKQPEKHLMAYDALVEELRISPEDKKIIDIAKGFAYLKDIKDDFRRQGIYNALPLFKEIAKRMGISPTDISYLLKSEILDFLESGKEIDASVVRSRRSGFSIYFSADKKIKCDYGPVALDLITKLGLPTDEKKGDELIGLIASKGEAKGRVVIVRGVADLKKVKKGDILVAVTTHPDYVMVMQKAAAIVTDEGGVTCHAAIVSRELGIPCIVGTKMATKVLSDGDMIHVNANLGFIKKI